MRLLLLLAFLLCACVPVRLIWAEQAFLGDSATPVHRALRLLGSTPNAAYWERLADLEQKDLPQPSLKRALEVNPRLTEARVRLGLLQEQDGNYGLAEETLLEAARYDRQYLPAWTLANYYFRRNNQNRFWQWARVAVPLDSGDPRAVLRLASAAEPDELAVLDQLQDIEQTAYPYMDLLIGAGRLEAAQRVARLVLGSREIRRDRLIDLSTRQLKAGNIAWALEIWNALNFSLEPERGPVLASAVFETPDGQGFHLTPASNPGVQTDWRGGEAVFSFEGVEPDDCPLFDQPIPAPQHRLRYRLRYEYKSSASGARWRMAGWESPALPLQEAWRSVEWTISIASGPGGVNLRILPLQLLYRRDPGTTPARGELDLRNLQLQIL